MSANEILDEDRAVLDQPSGIRRRLAWLRRTGGRGRRAALWALLLLVVAFVAYYLIGMAVQHRIGDDPAFGVAAPTTGGSRAIDMAAALIEREVDAYGWTPSDPFFMPGYALDNMPNFQQGLVYALGRFAVEMGDQVGRARGSSQVDADLDRAAGLLRYPPDRWIFDFSASVAPVASSESQYRSARRALLAYNQRLADGEAVFDRRADNLIETIERIAADLGSSSAVIAEHLDTGGGWLIDTEGDDIFYSVKGRLYGYFMILRALGEDFETVIDTTNLRIVWGQMLESLEQAATLQPPIVITGATDGLALPNHLAAQGFYLLRARTQLREISSVLVN